jgi:hypothetical protein
MMKSLTLSGIPICTATQQQILHTTYLLQQRRDGVAVTAVFTCLWSGGLLLLCTLLSSIADVHLPRPHPDFSRRRLQFRRDLPCSRWTFLSLADDLHMPATFSTERHQPQHGSLCLVARETTAAITHCGTCWYGASIRLPLSPSAALYSQHRSLLQLRLTQCALQAQAVSVGLMPWSR